MKPELFIIGLPRTASKLIQNSLNSYSEYCVIHEFHAMNPLHPTLLLFLLKHKILGRKLSSNDLSVWTSKKFFGSYWRADEHPFTIFTLSDDALEKAIESSHGPMSLLQQMMLAQRDNNEKLSCGARHPVHFTMTALLMKRFPSAKIIFLTRNWKNIRNSQLKKRVTKTGLRGFVKKLLIYLFVFLQATAAKVVLFFLKNNERVLLISYQKLTQDSDTTFKKICNHIEVPYKEKMSDISVKFDSSFDKSSERVPEQINDWQN